MQNFDELDLNPILKKSLIAMKYDTPTPIQAQAIPPALLGRDVLGSAQTGTGKTAAFAIPLVESLLKNSLGSALVMTPTRELARQIMDVVHQLLGPKSVIKTAFLIGGAPMGPQFMQLRQRPRLIIGTPGRINDHLERGSLMLRDAGFIVLDETDRMLDIGFGVQLDRIYKFLPPKKQTLMFSATMSPTIVKLSEKYLKDPVRVAVGSTTNISENIQQDVVRLEEHQKYAELVRQLNTRTGSVIIFVKTKFGTEKLAKRLNDENLKSDAINGDLRQSRRDRVIRDFQEKRFRILVATDVAARGLDIPHIEHVINYDLPQAPEDYIHRVGRTARAGATGSALCFISKEDGRKWQAIQKLIDPNAKLDPQDSYRKPSAPRGGKPSFGAKKRSYNPHGSDSWSDEPRRERSGGERSERSYAPKPYGERSPRADGPRGERSDRPFNRPRSDAPRSDAPRSDAPWGDRPRAPRADGPRPERSDRPRSDRPHSDRPRSDAPRSDRPRSDAPWGDRPRAPRPERSDAPRSDRPRSDRPRSDAPRSDAPWGDRPRTPRADGPRPERSDRPRTPRPEGSDAPRSFAKPAGAKKFGGKPFAKPQGARSGGFSKKS